MSRGSGLMRNGHSLGQYHKEVQEEQGNGSPSQISVRQRERAARDLNLGLQKVDDDEGLDPTHAPISPHVEVPVPKRDSGRPHKPQPAAGLDEITRSLVIKDPCTQDRSEITSLPRSQVIEASWDSEPELHGGRTSPEQEPFEYLRRDQPTITGEPEPSFSAFSKTSSGSDLGVNEDRRGIIPQRPAYVGDLEEVPPVPVTLKRAASEADTYDASPSPARRGRRHQGRQPLVNLVYLSVE
ncbi:hypothetical protein BKA65DRAFT_483806 [Rhexocercosporidium sp. MPI-PUGE-AT-0058]|nr:hypothetical protein BKA65DRAFT_483806 [Rhexocercosporidium sp. MPI-PUGE-AT-0058]